MARTKKQNTTDAQYAWVANGYVPDSRYQTMPHRTLNPAQYARARKAQNSEAIQFECYYQPREGQMNGQALPRIRLFARNEAEARLLAAKMFGRIVTKAVPMEAN